MWRKKTDKPGASSPFEERRASIEMKTNGIVSERGLSRLLFYLQHLCTFQNYSKTEDGVF